MLKTLIILIIPSHNKVVEGIQGLSRTYVHTHVCSPFVIALATSFIIKLQYNFTQVLGMTIIQNILCFSMIGSRSRSQ